MKESTDKLAILKKTFEESIYDVELIWMEGEVVWVAGEDDLLGMVTICKFDKPFATYVPKDSVDEFIIGWQNIR
jgi:hypothetical protein